MIHLSSKQHDIEIILSVDLSDPCLKEYTKLSKAFETRLTVNDNSCCVQAVNHAACEASGELIINLSDDAVYFEDYDLAFCEALHIHPEFNMDCVIGVYDGIKSRLMTQCILTQKYYNRFGYIYHPDYKSMYADDEYTEVAYKLNRVLEARHLTVQHLHYTVGAAAFDDTYAKQNHPDAYAWGQSVYNQRAADNFDINPDWVRT